MKRTIIAALAALPIAASASVNMGCERGAQLAVEAWKNQAAGYTLTEQHWAMQRMCDGDTLPCYVMHQMIESIQAPYSLPTDPLYLDMVFDEFYRNCAAAMAGNEGR